MSDLVLARNCCLARMLPGEAENGVGLNLRFMCCMFFCYQLIIIYIRPILNRP